ncbi:hypothetical protein [Azospirillum sp. TSO22-1]|uniref:hypothetical protein n=1 Tax=Azospirillum sp. TSO22-1 TaxID=716789 RepID=UPI000D603675|nr:hypothetical protein [Azospirillum sp. TSO22-1]PWC52951.1 hypothetical protein TSO221_12580 [Azospirillum sp. TSO22-1]
MPRPLPPYVPDAATIGAMTPRHTHEAHLHAPSPTLPLHDHTDWRRETAILAEVDSGYPWND